MDKPDDLLDPTPPPPGDDPETQEFLRQFDHAVKIGRDSGLTAYMLRVAELCAGAKITPQAYMISMFVSVSTVLAEDYATAGPEAEQRERILQMFAMYRAYTDMIEQKLLRKVDEGKMVPTPRKPKKSPIIRLN